MSTDPTRHMKKYGWKKVEPEAIGLTEEFIRAYANDSEFIEEIKRLQRARRESWRLSQFYVLD